MAVIQFLKKNKKISLIVLSMFFVGGIFLIFTIASAHAHRQVGKIRPLAERLYDVEGDYATLCTAPQITKLIKSSHCRAETKHWVVWKSVGFNRYWCADYKGHIKKERAIPEAGSFICQQKGTVDNFLFTNKKDVTIC